MKCNEPMGNIETPNSFPLPPLQVTFFSEVRHGGRFFSFVCFGWEVVGG